MQLHTELALVVITAFVAFYWFIRHRYNYWTRKNIPQLKPKFPHGNMDSLLPKGPAIGLQSDKFYQEFVKQGVKYGGVYGILQPMLCLTDPELIKDVLIKDFHYFSDRGIYVDKSGDPMNVHLLNQEKDEWKGARSKMSPNFTINKLRSLSKIMAELSENMVQYLDSQKSTQCVDIKYITQGFTMDVIGNTVFGIECNCFTDANSQFRQMVKRIMEPGFDILLKFCLAHYLPSVAKFFSVYLFDKETRKLFHSMVTDNLKHRKENNIERPDLFQVFVKMNSDPNTEFTIDDVTAQTMVFFLAGFETSSNTIKNCLLELSRNPEIQERLRQDIRQGLEKSNGILDYDSMSEMKYLHQCVDETLRLYPVLGSLTRRASKPYTFANTKDTIDQNTMLVVPVFSIQRDAKYWKDPLKFDPERFNEVNKPKIISGTYMPFGDGPRNCIGMRFGTTQVNIGLCRLLMNYKFTMHPETVYPVQFDPDSFGVTNITPIKLNIEKIR